MHFILRKLGIALAVALCAASANAVTLDWDTATWTNGATSGTPTTGVDVNIAPSAPNLFQPSLVNYPNVPTPAITRAFDGGLSPGQNTLEIAIDLPNGGNNQSVTFTLTFNSATYSAGVTNVSFSIFDIDYANDPKNNNTYQDRIFNISATSVTGATLTPTISNLGSVVQQPTPGVLIGTASSNDTAAWGPGTGNGNATISFSGQVRSITFSYGAGGLFADPTYQHIGIYDVSFTPVPETNPAWFGTLSCIAAAFLIRRHNARFHK